MATAGDIGSVRDNINEQDDTTFRDDVIDALIDANGIAGASAVLWRRKAAIYADQVNTSEAGASRALSDLNKHALAMAATWDGVKTAEDTEAIGGKQRARVHKIVRT